MRLRPEVVARAELAEEILRERADVAGTLAQARHANGYDAEPVVEILAKACLARPCSARSRLVAATTRTVTWIASLAAHAVKLAFLQDAQQLGLRRRMQVADFVEEDRAAVGESRICRAARPPRR